MPIKRKRVVAVKMPIHSEAATLYGTAREMVAAAGVLHIRDSARFIPSINLLMGYATELFLKSALAQDGVNGPDRHGHDLTSLYQKADGRGLLEFSERKNFAAMVEILANAHKQNSLRYLKPGSTVSVVTSIGPALFALNALDEHLRRNVVT